MSHAWKEDTIKALLDTDMHIDVDGSQTAQQRRLLVAFV
jgi:hypothetical protein